MLSHSAQWEEMLSPPEIDLVLTRCIPVLNLAVPLNIVIASCPATIQSKMLQIARAQNVASVCWSRTGNMLWQVVASRHDRQSQLTSNINSSLL